MHSAAGVGEGPFREAKQVWPFPRPTGWAWAWQEASLQDFEGTGVPSMSPTLQRSDQCAGGQAKDGLNIPSVLIGKKEHKTSTKCTRSTPSILLQQMEIQDAVPHAVKQSKHETETYSNPMVRQLVRNPKIRGRWAGNHTQGPYGPSVQGGTRPALYPKSQGITSHSPCPHQPPLGSLPGM